MVLRDLYYLNQAWYEDTFLSVMDVSESAVVYTSITEIIHLSDFLFRHANILHFCEDFVTLDVSCEDLEDYASISDNIVLYYFKEV